MNRTGRVVGTVEYRAGDGAKAPVPPGDVEIQTTHADATLSWVDGDTHGAAVIPIADYNRHLTDGTIQVHRA